MDHEEYQYLNLINEIIETGIPQNNDRTGVGTRSKFGHQMRFNLRKTFPLITTKEIFWRGVVEELLWFIKGDTNANNLSKKGVNIWKANSSREFLDSQGLILNQEGDLGPIYGFQWRHFGANYLDMYSDYENQGIDQLTNIIKQIKSDPESRRIILLSWNPLALHKMALPPCHILAQFLVDTSKQPHELSCIMYQRSADVGLGVPFNIASYSLLTRIIAHICNINSGDFVYMIGNAHIYNNHISALSEQLQRKPLDFPILKISPKKSSSIENFTFEDFNLSGYKPHGKIRMEMAV